MTKEAKSRRHSSFAGVLRDAALFTLAMSSGSSLPFAQAASASSEKEQDPQSIKTSRECRSQLAELKQSVGILAKVADKIGTLDVSPDEATGAIVARQSQNIHSCHEEVKKRHIANGDITFISSVTFDKYDFDDSLEKIPIQLSPEMRGYAVYDPNKISKADAKSVESIKKGDMSIEKVSLLLASEVPDLHAALYVLNDNKDVAHKESLDLLLKNLPKASKGEKEALLKVADESLPKVTRSKDGSYVDAPKDGGSELWYSLKGNDRLSKAVSKLISSIEPEVIMPSKQEISEQLAGFPASVVKSVCEETTVQSYNDLSQRSPRSAEKYGHAYDNMYAICGDRGTLEANIKAFNGPGQEMTQAGSVYIPFKANKGAMKELHAIAKEADLGLKGEDKESGYASKVMQERAQGGRSVEL